jgi:hypothetical protein
VLEKTERVVARHVIFLLPRFQHSWVLGE